MHGLTTTTATFPKNITTVYYILYRNSIQNSCIHASEYTAATATAYIYISATHSSYALFSKKICSNILRSDRRNGHRTHINSNKIYGTDSFERFLGSDHAKVTQKIDQMQVVIQSLEHIHRSGDTGSCRAKAWMQAEAPAQRLILRERPSKKAQLCFQSTVLFFPFYFVLRHCSLLR